MPKKNFDAKSMAELRVVILAGGRGARLAPYTTILPKPLMPIGDVSILEILIRQLRNAGFQEITLAVGYLASLLEAYFGDGSQWGVRIQYSREDKPLGTAGPLALVSGLNNSFLVVNGDLLTTLDFAAMVRFHRERGAAATVGVFQKSVKIDLGIVETDGQNCITGYIEKPTLDYEVSVGAYVMEPLVLSYVRPAERFDLPDLIKKLIAEGLSVIGYRFQGYWLDVGRMEDYEQAVELFGKERSTFLPSGE